jgi:hypothetical protein
MNNDLQSQINSSKKRNCEAMQKAEEEITALQATRDHYKSAIGKRQFGGRRLREEPDSLADVQIHDTPVLAPPSRAAVINDLRGQPMGGASKVADRDTAAKPRNIREGK